MKRSEKLNESLANAVKFSSEFLAQRKGLPVLIGVALVLLSLIFNLMPIDWPVVGWFAVSDVLLHLGVIIGLLGILIGDAL